MTKPKRSEKTTTSIHYSKSALKFSISIDSPVVVVVVGSWWMFEKLLEKLSNMVVFLV